MKHDSTDVVVALIWRAETLLIGLRPEGKALPGLWEFPGGKCEANESHGQALQRECHEELGVRVVVGPLVWGPVHSRTPTGGLNVYFYHARLHNQAQEPQPLTTVRLQWALPQHLERWPFCPADEGLVRALVLGEVTAPSALP